MYAHTRWHADGLRWLGSLLVRLADRLERAATIAAAVHAGQAEEEIEETRRRLASPFY